MMATRDIIFIKPTNDRQFQYIEGFQEYRNDISSNYVLSLTLYNPKLLQYFLKRHL